MVAGERFHKGSSDDIKHWAQVQLAKPLFLLSILPADVCARGAQESALEDVGNLSWGAFKPVLADAVIAHLAPLQQQYAAVMSDPAYLDEVPLL